MPADSHRQAFSCFIRIILGLTIRSVWCWNAALFLVIYKSGLLFRRYWTDFIGNRYNINLLEEE
jgi:hypothetical protein